MTPEQIEKHRKRFEEIARHQGFVNAHFERNNIGSYLDLGTQLRFRGYLMHAENVELILPKTEIWSFETSTFEFYHAVDIWSTLKTQGIKIKSSGSE